ncbi:helix-turn-helix protein [Nocardiopsis sp. Huas11]|uniref:helix-turn-helix domain-containing protein n=1 Tax=Nocardiopsis sp. Huas11 TaxID=2183912 RepID=UPI000EAEF2C6|nr:helix-turn-helix transcriptional regulator [Nocardiopsis sp. Huas11]RKS09816.1 helix-turn-helix protein [Nocardiopsis sp. Huas11]
MTDLHLVHDEEPDAEPRTVSLALRYYASELKRHREAAGLTQAQLAELIPYSKSMVSMVETAKRSPVESREGDKVTSRFTECCDEMLNTGGALGRILPLLEDTSDPYPPWFKPYANLEAEATAIYTFQSQTVPGLLQTEAYARAVLGSGRPYMGDDELERQTAARIQRQQILQRESPPTLLAVIDELVVRRPIGGTTVLRQQVERLIELAESRVVSLGIVPIGATEHAGLDGSWNLLDFIGEESLLYIEAGGTATMSNQAKDVLPVRQAFGALCMQALAPRATVELMMGIARDL